MKKKQDKINNKREKTIIIIDKQKQWEKLIYKELKTAKIKWSKNKTRKKLENKTKQKWDVNRRNEKTDK